MESGSERYGWNPCGTARQLLAFLGQEVDPDARRVVAIVPSIG
jgi:hypothetical protein